jgi:hypothetical protein
MNATACKSRALFAMLARINDCMMDLRRALTEDPQVLEATRGCDLRNFDDQTHPDSELYVFDAYVEAETRSGQLFCWSLEIRATSAGWEVHRLIGRRTTDGEDPIVRFQDFTYEKFQDLAANATSLAAEFVQSAKEFNFETR